MKTLIATLFIIDFSGSMYQKIIDKSKHEVLQTKLSELSSSYASNIPVGIYSFGQEGNKSCTSLQFDEMKFSQMPKWLSAQKPGTYSKTPLSYAISKVAEATKKLHFQQVVIITDGADSCGQDPCEALQKLGKTLEKRGTPLFLDLVGYDVKMDSKKLECPNFKSRALKYKFHKAESDTALSENLVKIDRKIKAQKAVNILAAGKGAEAEKFLSQTSQGTNSSGEPIEKNPDSPQPGVPPKPLVNLFSPELRYSEDLLSSVRILNPPSNRLFYAYKAGQLIKKWRGNFAAILAPGAYKLRTVGRDKTTQNLKITVDKRQNKLVPYRLFLKDTTPHLIVEKTLFPLKIKAKGSSAAEADGGDPKERASVLKLPQRIVGANVIPLREGNWILDVEYPWWLRDILRKEIRLSPGEKRTINFHEVHRKELKWLRHPKPGQQLALLITTDFGEEMRVLVPGGTKKIPIIKSWDHHWIGL